MSWAHTGLGGKKSCWSERGALSSFHRGNEALEHQIKGKEKRGGGGLGEGGSRRSPKEVGGSRMPGR